MPAPNIDVFLAGEAALLKAVSAVLAAALPPVRGQGGASALPIPRADAYSLNSTPTDQLAFIPGANPPKAYVSASRGSFGVRVVNSTKAHDLQATYVGKIRAALAPAAQRITSAVLPYHELLELEETGLAFVPGEEPGTEEALFTYAYVLGYPPTQYPA